jgi:hypothetical protein
MMQKAKVLHHAMQTQMGLMAVANAGQERLS